MTSDLNLHPRYRKQLEVLLHQYLPDIEVWVYGSRVNGRSHEGSDLDLVLRSRDLTAINNIKLYAFKEALQASTIPFLVEVRDWSELPESFRHEIERKHVVLIAINLDK